MIFEKYLLPDLMLASFDEVTPELLLKLGMSGVISDIDNTLATYDDEIPPPRVIKWCENMLEHGIAVSLISNNTPERVAKFCESLPVKGYADVKKPSIEYLTAAAREMGVEKKRIIVLGDQLLTDALAAKKFGAFCIIVPPIKDKKTLFFRFKRALEAPYIKKYKRMNK